MLDSSPDERGNPEGDRKVEIRPHSTPLTLKWLDENYEITEGVCIPRSTLYVHYIDFCHRNVSQPINAASFGKIIRQQFPQITTRRLGTRGQSKYHYYGIGVKETSLYYDIIYSAKNVYRSSDCRKESVKESVPYSPRTKLGTLLPDFPNINDISLPADVSVEKVETFLIMYRAHCQRILDTVIRANFDEVENFLVHFWQEIPAHIVPILDCEQVATLVGVCDSILYKTLATVLMPTFLQALPESLIQVIGNFAQNLDHWLKTAIQSIPATLRNIKYDLARRFSQVLRRQMSLNNLCEAAGSVVYNPDATNQMLNDWIKIDFNSITKQTLYTMDHYSERAHKTIIKLCGEFENLLETQSQLESYTSWLESMVDRCVVQGNRKEHGSLRRFARQFLLIWSCFGTRIIRDMTLYSAPSFGSFHLLHLMFDDYVMYLVEAIYSQERTNDLLRILKGQQPIEETNDVVLLKLKQKTCYPSDPLSCQMYTPDFSYITAPPPSECYYIEQNGATKRKLEQYTKHTDTSPTSASSVASDSRTSADAFTSSPDCCYTQMFKGSADLSDHQPLYSCREPEKRMRHEAAVATSQSCPLPNSLLKPCIYDGFNYRGSTACDFDYYWDNHCEQYSDDERPRDYPRDRPIEASGKWKANNFFYPDLKYFTNDDNTYEACTSRTSYIC